MCDEEIILRPDVRNLNPVGIFNLGNICFASAALQPLMHIPNFVSAVLRIWPQTTSMKEIQLFTLAYVISSMKEQKSMFLPSSNLLASLGFGEYKQYDLQEFFINLIKEYKQDGGFHFDENIAYLEKLFRIVTRTKDGDAIIESVDYCLWLQSNIPLERSLGEFTTNDDGLAKGKVVITELPPVLCCGFGGGSRMGARRVGTTFPLDVMIDKYTYRLYSIADFHGRDNAGHYRSFVRKGDTWLLFDDTKVTPVTDEEVHDYVSSRLRITFPVLCMYINDTELERLFAEHDTDPIPRVLEYTRESVKEPVAMFLNVATERSFDLHTLQFETTEFCHRFDTCDTFSELYQEFSEIVVNGNTMGPVAMWRLAGGVVISPLEKSGKMTPLFTDRIVVVPADDLPEDAVLVTIVGYSAEKGPMFLGYNVSSKGNRLRDTVKQIYDRDTENMWIHLPFRAQLMPLGNQTLMELCPQYIYGISVIIELPAVPVCAVSGALLTSGNESLNIIDSIPGFCNTLDAPGFYRYHLDTFSFKVKHCAVTYELMAPMNLEWDVFFRGIGVYLGIQEESWHLVRDKDGSELNVDFPPQYLSNITTRVIIRTERRAELNDIILTPEELEEDDNFTLPGTVSSSSSSSSSSACSADTSEDDVEPGDFLPPPEPYHHPKEDSSKIKPARQAKLVYKTSVNTGPTVRTETYLLDIEPPLDAPPLVPYTMAPAERDASLTDTERLMLRLTPDQSSFDVSVSTELNESPNENQNQLQAELNEHLIGTSHADPASALAAYGRLIKIGPLLTSNGRLDVNETFMCNRIHCGASMHLTFASPDTSACKVSAATPHRCVTMSKTTTEQLHKYLRGVGLVPKLGKEFMEKVKRDLHDDHLKDQRIRRAYQHVHEMTIAQRLASWENLPNLCRLVEADGGTSKIIEEDGCVTFCGIMPSFCHRYVESEIFFGVVSTDGSFQTGVGRGNILAIVTLTGSRTILPLAWAWAATESKANMTALISLFKDSERGKLETVISDEGSGILSAVTDILGEKCIAICAKHRESHISPAAAKYYWGMIKADTKSTYLKNRLKLEMEHPGEFAKLRERLPRLTRWETAHVRDGMTTNGIVESFNSMCAPLKKMEPYVILRQVYAMARQQIIALRGETEIEGLTYTSAAHRYLNLCVQIAGRIQVRSKNPDGTYNLLAGESQYQVDTILGTCSCCTREQVGLPCPHIVRCCIDTSKSWSKFVHPRYILGDIRKVFPEIPVSIDFSTILPVTHRVRPPVVHQLRGKQKRGRGAMDKRSGKRNKR